MVALIEKLIARVWNGSVGRRQKRHSSKVSGGIDFGFLIKDEQLTKHRFTLSQSTRCEHIAVLGKTGSGKSYFLRHLAGQDIASGHGFVYFDLHGDTTPFLLSLLAAREQRTREDLSEKVMVIDPSDSSYCVGLNILENTDERESFVQIAEFAQILKMRWHLESFGARTEELLRNSLYALRENNLTLLELSPLLTNAAFRSTLVRQIKNPEVQAYFLSRYDQASEGMQAVMRDAILNKVSVFTADPHFRHILGQTQSTISLEAALDQGAFVLISLPKGRLGEQAATLGSLILSRLKNALFSRKSRKVFTLYCDEVQNLVAYDSGLDTLFSEARKFAISVVSANQFLDQYPPAMRSAILSVGTHVSFQLSSADAEKMAHALGGSKTLSETLKNLPHRQLIAKSAASSAMRIQVPNIPRPDVSYQNLLSRSLERWARKRSEVEQAIQERLKNATTPQTEVLDGWE